METSEFKKIIREEIKAVLKEDSSNLYIVGVIMAELQKSKRLTVNSPGREIWFTDIKNGNTLKTKII